MRPTRPEAHLRTDDLHPDLGGHSARGGVVRVGGQAVQVFLFLVTGMLLARLLTPEEFGLFAMVVSLTAFVSTFRDFGFPMAAVQRRNLRQEQASGLFWVAMQLNLVVGLFVAAMAPLLARFYGEPRILMATLVMGAAIVLQGLGILHEGLLVRRMRFGRLVLVELGALALGAVVGVGSALAGAGYWALVLQALTVAVARSLALWRACRWRPGWPGRRNVWRNTGVREMLRYGSGLSLYRIITHVGFNLDRVLLGRLVGTAAMGLYDNSFRWSRYPKHLLAAPLTEVAVSGLSRVQDDPQAYRDSCRAGFLPVYSAVLPLVAYMAVDARNVILVLLGSQWVAAIPLFRLLCLATFASGLLAITQWIYLSRGETGRQLRWGAFYAPLMVVAVVIGVRWGAIGVAAGFAAGAWSAVLPGLWYCVRGTPLSLGDVGAIAWRPILASGLAALGVVWISLVSDPGAPLWRAVLHFGAFGAIYASAWVLLPGGRRDLRELRRVGRLVLSAPPRWTGQTEAA